MMMPDDGVILRAVARVDPEDDDIRRFIVHHYRYDPQRRERRHVVVAAFDNEREFRACMEGVQAEIRRRREAGEPFVFFPRHRSVLAYDQFIVSCRAAGFSPAIVQEAGGISTLGLVAAGLGVTVVAASYQALSLTGVRLVPVVGHQLTLQVAWAADNTNTALPGFLETARQIAAQTTPQPETLPLAGP